MSEYRVVKYKASIFTPNLLVQDWLKFFNAIVALLKDKLTGTPIILPVPNNAPISIPRFQFISEDQKWQLSVSLERTDINFVDSDILMDSSISDEEFLKVAAEFFYKYKLIQDIHIQRLAFITERIRPDERATSRILSEFANKDLMLKGKPFHEVSKFEIHSLKTYDWSGYHINSWIRIKSLDFVADKIVPVMMIQNDLNTLSFEKDPKKDFSAQEIEDYFLKINDHLLDILRKYNLD